MKLNQLTTVVFALLLAMASTAAFANDQVVSTVTNLPGPQAVIVNNGVPSGTIQLWYTVVGTAFPCGSFAQFNLGLTDTAGSNGQTPNYPVTLNLAASGNGTPVQLSPAPSQFSGTTSGVSGPGWSGSSVVTVSIDCSKLGTPTDAQQIDGNLNERTDPSGSHLDTISTIQAHIKLVFPSPTACLKLYSFQTDQDSGTLLTGVAVTANKNGSVKATNPGTISADALVVNTCGSSQTFDAKVGLDPQWQTIPNNNPGNATFTYTKAGEVDPSTFNLAAFGTGTPQGQAVCLSNVTLGPGDSFLATVHSAIMSGITVTSLPMDSDFDFPASLSNAGSSCGTLLPTSLVGPSNPATSILPYTVH
jgi:hypothetical protein